MLQQINSD